MAGKVPDIRFKIFKGDEVIGEKLLSQPAIKVGKLGTHHISLDDEGVAMTHAVIQVGGPEEISIFSLDSDHPTLVNGKAINKCKIQSGDLLSIGPFKILVEVMVEAEARPPVPPPPGAMAPPPTPQKPQAGAPPPLPQAQPPVPPFQRTSSPPVARRSAPPQQMAPKVPSAAPRPAGVIPPVPFAPPPPFAGMIPGIPGMGGEEETEAERTAAAARLIDLSTIEDSSTHTMEIIPVWQDTVFAVKHLVKKTPTFSIGEEPTCDFWIPPEHMGGQSKVMLAESSGVLHYIPQFTGGDVTFENGDVKSFKDILPSGTGSFQVPPGARCKIDFGDITFLINSVPAPRKPKLPLMIDWANQSFTGLSFLAHAILMFLIFFFPPESRTLSLDQLSESNRYVKFLLQPQEIIPEEELPEWMQKKDKADDKEGGKGKRHKGEEGQMGDPKQKKTDNMYGIKGPEDNPDPHMARDQKEELAKGAGILSVLQQALNMPTSPFGRDSALGTDAENALGALMGNQIGPNFGFGGLGLRGTGRGGGGTGEGTIGLGNLGTIGHGGGGGSGVGYGRGAGGLHGRGGGKVPSIRPGTAEVKGSLSKEVIRRVIRQHLNEVRFCYEQQLAVKPDLNGRVAIQFIISPTGAVQMSKVASSTLGNSACEDCIAKAVRRWTFPSPEGGGVVIVTYPFVLQPAGEEEGEGE
jgi:outer membrane biosynthesis protein TonB